MENECVELSRYNESSIRIAREATLLVQKLEDCPWCGAKKGEECNLQEKNCGFVPKVHIGRMPVNISPEEYLKKNA